MGFDDYKEREIISNALGIAFTPPALGFNASGKRRRRSARLSRMGLKKPPETKEMKLERQVWGGIVLAVNHIQYALAHKCPGLMPNGNPFWKYHKYRAIIFNPGGRLVAVFEMWREYISAHDGHIDNEFIMELFRTIDAKIPPLQ